MISVFPDEEGIELSAILSESVNLAELQDPSFAVPNDHVDQVIGNVEGPNPEQQVDQRTDYERACDRMDEEFRKERAERREERREQLRKEEIQIRKEEVQIRKEEERNQKEEAQEKALEQVKISSRNQCIQRIDQSARDLRAEAEERINQSTQDLRNDAEVLRAMTEHQMDCMVSSFEENAKDLVRQEKDRSEEQMNVQMRVLRIETQMQIENLRNRNDQQVERVLEYGLRKQAEAVEEVARKFKDLLEISQSHRRIIMP